MDKEQMWNELRKWLVSETVNNYKKSHEVDPKYGQIGRGMDIVLMKMDEMEKDNSK